MNRIALLLAACAAVPTYAADTDLKALPNADDPETIVVTGSVYRGEISSGGARIDVDVKDLPISISVVTKELIKDREIRNLRDLAENVAGVRSRSSGVTAFSADFTVRGLQGGAVAVNGYRVENFASVFDPQAVERVEFLKGPASVLYGASGALSGLVNIVTKVPQHDDFLVVGATVGSPAYGRTGIDGNVSISDDLDARVNASISRENVTNAFRDTNGRFAVGSLRWHPGRFSLLAEASVGEVIQPTRRVVNYRTDERFVELSRHFKLGEPADKSDVNAHGGRIEARFDATDTLTFRQGVNLQKSREVHLDVGVQRLIGPDTISRFESLGDERVRYLVSQSEMRWTVSLLGLTHKLLGGFEYSKSRFGGICCDSAPIAGLSLINPVYGAALPPLGLTQFFENTVNAKAFYLQDYVEAGTFKFLGGIRRDNTRSGSSFCDLTTTGCPNDPVVSSLAVAKKKAWTPRAGVVWQPNDRTTAFVSYARSFNPNTSLDRNNDLLPPERGTQYEVGVRQELAEPGKLLVSLTGFNLTRQNIADCDPLFLDCSRSVAIGEQRVKGVELEASGKPLEWLDVVAAYTYLDGKVTKSDVATSGIPVGSKLPEAAKHSASLFARVGLDRLGIDDVAVSAGVYYVTRRPGRNYFNFFGTTPQPFERPIFVLPDSTRLDLGAYWTVNDHFKVQANLTNVFDTKVFEPVNQGFYLSQRRRFTLGGTVSF